MAKTRDDLDQSGELALEHYRKHCPNRVRQLEAAGTLYDHLVDAQEEYYTMLMNLRRAGVDAWTAMGEATREWLTPPDWGDD